MRRLIGLIRFTLCFIREFLLANLELVRIILFVKEKRVEPHLYYYEVSDLHNHEILLLAQLITLTPGTIATEIDTQRKTILVHILNAPNPTCVIDKIDKGLKKAMLGVTRC